MATVKALVIGGGGGGGYQIGGGGGAGGYVENNTFAVTAQAYAITVGNGGAGSTTTAKGSNGQDSVFDSITGTGGGGGGSNTAGAPGVGANGGSGGGGGEGAGGTGSQGHNGGGAGTNGSGGGGGAGAAGVAASSDAGAAGGAGTASSINGSSVTRAGGGGGGSYLGGGVGAGGTGGGGAGGDTSTSINGVNGTANTGGGGGGGAYDGTSGNGGAGGSGIVIISYVTADFGTCTGGTITTSGANTIHTFTSSGTFTVVLIPTPFRQTDWPSPVRRKQPTVDRFGFLGPLNLPIYFYVPPPPFKQTEWPLPMRRRIGKPALYSVAQGINIPLMADYFYGATWLTVDGVQRAPRRDGYGQIDAGTLNVVDSEAEVPSTATFTCRGFTPVAGMEVSVNLGSAALMNPDPVFAGNIIQVNQRYVGTPANTLYDVACIDWTWQLNKRKVNKRYVGWTGTAIATDLIQTYAPTFRTDNIELFGVIDEISFTNQDLTAALTQLAKRLGARWFAGYVQDIHMFTSASLPRPTDLTAAHPTLTEFAVSRDLSQMITRAFSEGGGNNAAGYVSAGSTTLPLDTSDPWWQATGGLAVAGPQRIIYTAWVAGGGGSTVGPGVAPSSAPTLVVSAAPGNVNAGAHQYATTFVTAAGESIPGPIATISTTIDPPDTAAGVGAIQAAGSMDVGTHEYQYTFVTAYGETTPSVDDTQAAHATAGFQKVQVTIGLGPSGTTARNVYRRFNSAGGFLFLRQVADNYNTYFVDSAANSTRGAGTPPTVNTAALPSMTVGLSNIPIGPTGTTGRNIYRSVAAGSQLKLQQTIANNATTTASDNMADASLGVNVPTSDTSGLTQPTGQVLAGATTLLVAGTGAFPSAGWAKIGGNVIQYTGITGSSLTGVPATGVGAILQPVTYGSQVTACPMLTGIPASGDGAIQYDINAGDEVNLLAQYDDLAAQAVLAGLIGGDGIQEDYQQDGRIGYEEALAKATARVQLQGDIDVAIAYKVRDPASVAGASITAALTSPTSVTGTFDIKRVTITDFGSSPERFPLYQVDAGPRYTFEQLLREIRP